MIEPTRVDVRCAVCEHPPEVHHAYSGQCYDCPAEDRCVRYTPKSREIARAMYGRPRVRKLGE